MFRLMMKYLKPFALSIVVVVGLLFVQAQTELALPDYMSNIVNTGIQTGGIEGAIPDVIRQSEYERIAIFLTEEDQAKFLNNFKKIESENATAQEKKENPILEQEAVYVKEETNQAELRALESKLAKAEVIVYSLENIAENEVSSLDSTDAEQAAKLKEMLAQLPEGMDVFDLFRRMPQEQIDEITKEMSVAFEAMGDSTINTAAASFIKEEYIAIGKDVDAIQTQYILVSGANMLGVSLLSTFCAILVGLFASRIAAGVGRDLRGDVFEKVESFSSAEFNKFSTASLITRNTNDIQQVQLVIVMFIRIVIYAPIIGIGALIKVLNTNVSMTWIIGLVLVIILGMIGTIFTVAMPKFKIQQKLLDKMNMVMREFLDGMPVIRAFNTQKHEEKKFDEANTNIMRTQLFINRCMSAMMPVMMFVMNGVALLVIWYGGHEIDAGNMQIGDIMAFIQYTMQIIMAFLMISMVSIMLPRAAVSGTRVLEVLDTKATIEDPKHPKTFMQNQRGYIDFDHVSFRYPGAEEDVLHDISFTAKPGETTAFIGSTGSGKSTIVNLVPRFYDVSEGAIRIDGVDIRDVTQHELREKIGYVPQKGILFSGTIASNLRYAKEDASLEELDEASRIAQAEEFIKAKPDLYEESISQGGTNVSGGQKQRLSIARALVKQPEIYIFDDSFSALDFKTDAKLRKALNEVTQKTKSTVLLVAQRISSIMHADRIVVLDQGRVVGIGTHDELMNTCEVYQEIAYSQLSKEELGNE